MTRDEMISGLESGRRLVCFLDGDYDPDGNDTTMALELVCEGKAVITHVLNDVFMKTWLISISKTPGPENLP